MIYKISVSNMHCEKCSSRIEKALNETGINYSIDLNAKTVTVDGCEKCLNTALSELDDLGFDAKVQ